MNFKLASILALIAAGAQAETCGGSVSNFISGVKAEAVADGQDPGTVDQFFAGAQIDDAVLRADRAQGVFQKDFISFSRALISQNRIDNGRIYGDRFAATFDQIERIGIDRGVLWRRPSKRTSVRFRVISHAQRASDACP